MKPDEGNCFRSVTSPAGLQYEVHDNSTDLHTFMDVVLDGHQLRTFAGYGLAVQAIKDGELDDLVRQTAPACETEDPELFFPVADTGSRVQRRMAAQQIEEAKAVCRRCPIRVQCLDEALARGEEFGVWGGLSEKERRALKRRAARQGVAA
jgi:WhiB family redox-sensing transcriptional regulator